MKQTVFLIYSAGVFLFSLFESITTTFNLQWFVCMVINLLSFYYIMKVKKEGVEKLPGMTMILTPLFLTSLLIMAGIWFVLGTDSVLPLVLVLVSVLLWFVYDLTASKSTSN